MPPKKKKSKEFKELFKTKRENDDSPHLSTPSIVSLDNESEPDELKLRPTFTTESVHQVEERLLKIKHEEIKHAEKEKAIIEKERHSLGEVLARKAKIHGSPKALSTSSQDKSLEESLGDSRANFPRGNKLANAIISPNDSEVLDDHPTRETAKSPTAANLEITPSFMMKKSESKPQT